MKYYLAIKRNDALMLAATWMDPENIMLSKEKQIQRTTHCVIPLMWDVQKGRAMAAQWQTVSFWVNENVQTSDKGLLSITYKECENTNMDRG